MVARSASDGLVKSAANYVPLSPVQFLERSALIWPDKIAVRHGALAYTYREFEARSPQAGIRERLLARRRPDR